MESWGFSPGLLSRVASSLFQHPRRDCHERNKSCGGEKTQVAGQGTHRRLDRRAGRNRRQGPCRAHLSPAAEARAGVSNSTRRVRLRGSPIVRRKGEAERGPPLGPRRGGRRGLWRRRRVLSRGHGQARGQLRAGAGGAQPRGALPALGLAAQPEDQTARERGSEITSYVVYGVTAELVRRLVRRWL